MFSLLTREDARRIGINRFYTGILCNNGHDSDRRTTDGKCMCCLRAKKERNLNTTWRTQPDEQKRKVSRNLKVLRRINYPEKEIIKRARKSAHRRNITCTLVPDDITITTNCPCCGVLFRPFEDIPESHLHSAPSDTMSLDRIDSTKGYEKGNIVLICLHCNRVKNNGTLKDHLNIAFFLMRLQKSKLEK